ncbi:putative malate dehydrogenase 1B [Trichomycterus rosablanca]|uniref:putative malate dehydrogenase 1B n=1 Tax=Trichomycterus rosablanca TaxID=2290929 RepID=UPI002F352A4D
MAKFVLAGKADCPYYAKAELLADVLHRALPDFHVHKISVHPTDWKSWLEKTCISNGWKHESSPIVWRELIDRGGKGKLLGGFNEFLEYAQGYYGITPDMGTDLMLKIAAENLEVKERNLQEEERQRELLKPLQIWISSALHPTGYQLIPLLFTSGVFRDFHSISLHLLDMDHSVDSLLSLQMEMEDLALDQLHRVLVHTDLNQAFQSADHIIFLDEREDREEQDGAEHLLRRIGERYKRYGQTIEENGRPDVRVLVAGDVHVNLKCSLLMENAPSVCRRRFVAVGTQVENEARAQLAMKLSVKASDVADVIVWGNIGGRFHVDLQRAKVHRYKGSIRGPAGFSQPVSEMIHDRKWLKDDFPGLVSSRRGAVSLKTSRNAVAISAAAGILAALKAWTDGSSSQEIFSMGVVSTGQFGVPDGLVFCMPVTFHHGEWSVCSDVSIGEELRSEVEAAVQEVQLEKTAADGIKTEDPVPTQHSAL